MTVPRSVPLIAFAAVAWFSAGSSSLPETSPPGAVPDLYQAFAGREPERGEWLGSEPLPAALGLPNAGRQSRFVYGSTDGRMGSGRVAVSGALFFPDGKPPAGGWPVVAWAHGTVGIADSCAPSVAGRSPRDREYLGAWLAAGYAIVATDYQGLGTPGAHPYLDSRAAAYSMLDAVRAARGRLPELSNKIILVGQSQGAAAAISTAALAPIYAPELGIIGTVATGVPNVSASLGGANRDARAKAEFDPAVAYLLYLAASASESDPGLEPAQGLTTAAQGALDTARSACALPLLQTVRALRLHQKNAVTPVFDQIFAKAIAAAHYPSLALEQPLFVGIGADDVDTPASGQLAVVADACRAGTRVETHVYAGRDHSTAVNTSFRDSSTFAARLLRAAEAPACNSPQQHQDAAQ